jgi:hypothetical protein
MPGEALRAPADVLQASAGRHASTENTMNDQTNDNSALPSSGRKSEDDAKPNDAASATADIQKAPSTQTPVWHDTDDQDIEKQ